MSRKRKQSLPFEVNINLTPPKRSKKVTKSDCILDCEIETSEYVTRFSKASRETVLKAARLRNDNRVVSIFDSLGEDLYASQHGYHRKCYQNYTHKKASIYHPH